MKSRGCLFVLGLLACLPTTGFAQNGNFVPGSGRLLEKVGDDFEDPDWEYIFNEPKSSEELNERQNLPLGKSNNGRWYEGAKRGQPDIVKRIETPEGGLPGSSGALLIKSMRTGIPGKPTFKMQQEDFILNVQYRTGGTIPVAQSPSVVTRVYLPPTQEWERRTGPHFAFRIALETTKKTPNKLIFLPDKKEDEVYWPGLFICMDTKEQTRQAEDSVYFRLRANGQGGDVKGPPLDVMGWWTLGLAVSANGAVHYYAKPGVEDLTAADYLGTQYPYGYRAETFRSAFFNIVNMDNGKSWTSTLIIDDTFVFLGTSPAPSQSPQSLALRASPLPSSKPVQQATKLPTIDQRSNSQVLVDLERGTRTARKLSDADQSQRSTYVRSTTPKSTNQSKADNSLSLPQTETLQMPDLGSSTPMADEAAYYR